MKKVFFTFLSLLLILFLAITILKYRSSDVGDEHSDLERTTAEKEKIQRFWEIYRHATEHRIAGRLQKAAEDYQRALMLNDRHEDVLYYLGNMYLELGEFKKAEKTWKRLLQINPHSTRAHFQLGIVYLNFKQKEFFDIKLAEVEFERALEINKEETGPLLRLGQIALIRGDLLEAQYYFDAVLGSNYRSVEAYFLKGYIAWKTGNSQKAVTLLKKAAEYSRPLKQAHGVLGEGDAKSGRPLNLSERSHHQPLFQTHFQDLNGLDELSLSQRMEHRYQKLDEFLDRVRRKAQS